MGRSLLFFALGYMTARYLILRSGVDAYMKSEGHVVSGAKDRIDDFTEPETNTAFGY